MNRPIHNILSKIAADAIKKSPEKQLNPTFDPADNAGNRSARVGTPVDPAVKAITRFIEASGDDIINAFGGKDQVESQVKNELSGDMKSGIARISTKIENAVNVFRLKYILTGIIIIIILGGIGYFVFKKYRHKIPFIGKFFDTEASTKSIHSGSEVSEASEHKGGSRRRIRIRRRRH